jgi:integrase/recombinase XerD
MYASAVNLMELSICMLQLQQSVNSFLLSRAASGCRTSTIANYQLFINKFLDTESITALTEITPTSLRDYIVKRRAEGLKSSTLHVQAAALVTWLSWLSGEGVIDDIDWHKRIEKVKLETREPVCLTPIQCSQLLQAADREHHTSQLVRYRELAMLYLLLDTGMRESELISIRLCDVELENRLIHLPHTKNGHERRVYFSAETKRQLCKYLTERGHKGEYLWLTRENKPPSRTLVLQMVKRIGYRAGISRLNVHALRHTFATMVLRNGMNPCCAQAILGHADIRTTMRYVHLLDEDVQHAYQDSSPIHNL